MTLSRQNQNREARAKNNPTDADRLVLTYYTDPLCCWCWGFENIWQNFIAEHGDRFDVRYVMGGLIKDWKTYSDPYNAVSNPIQMAPVWMQVSHVTGCSIEPAIWHHDPPQSSYPACIAVKAAALQSSAIEAAYLHKLREAVMVRQKNIGQEKTLYAIAEELGEEKDEFDLETFNNDWRGSAARDLFRADLQRVAFHKIGRFPTITCTRYDTGKGIIMVGYRTYDVLQEELLQMTTAV